LDLVVDPTIIVICMNLKYWKVLKLKSLSLSLLRLRVTFVSVVFRTLVYRRPAPSQFPSSDASCTPPARPRPSPVILRPSPIPRPSRAGRATQSLAHRAATALSLADLLARCPARPRQHASSSARAFPSTASPPLCTGSLLPWCRRCKRFPLPCIGHRHAMPSWAVMPSHSSRRLHPSSPTSHRGPSRRRAIPVICVRLPPPHVAVAPSRAVASPRRRHATLSRALAPLPPPPAQ